MTLSSYPFPANQPLGSAQLNAIIAAAFVAINNRVQTGGDLGTPSAGVLTNATGLPLTTGVTGILSGANGGTGVANTSKTITLGGNLTTSGAFATTLTVTGITAVTLPTTGTLATLAGSESLSNKTLPSPVFSGTATGTYTLGGTPTLSGGTLSGTTTGPGQVTLNSTGTVFQIGGADNTVYTAGGFGGSPRITLLNTDTTLSTFARLSFQAYNASSAAVALAGLTMISTVKTAGSESAELTVQLRNAGTIGERSRWYAGGDFRVGSGSALATNATDGFLLIPTCAGTPTGTPTNAGNGQTPLIWDRTNLKLYAYTGGAWKASAAFT